MRLIPLLCFGNVNVAYIPMPIKPFEFNWLETSAVSSGSYDNLPLEGASGQTSDASGFLISLLPSSCCSDKDRDKCEPVPTCFLDITQVQNHYSLFRTDFLCWKGPLTFWPIYVS